MSSLKNPATPVMTPQARHRSPALTGLSWSVADPDPAANRFFSKLLLKTQQFTSPPQTPWRYF
jgi:hypothetical protein